MRSGRTRQQAEADLTKRAHASGKRLPPPWGPSEAANGSSASAAEKSDGRGQSQDSQDLRGRPRSSNNSSDSDEHKKRAVEVGEAMTTDEASRRPESEHHAAPAPLDPRDEVIAQLRSQLQALSSQLQEERANSSAQVTGLLAEVTSLKTSNAAILDTMHQQQQQLQQQQQQLQQILQQLQQQPAAAATPSTPLPKPSYAEAAQKAASSAPLQQPHTPRQPRAHSIAKPSLAASLQQKLCFVVSGSPAELASVAGLHGDDLASGLSSQLSDRLATGVRVLDAFPIGKATSSASRRHRFFIRVERLSMAEAIVRNRCRLKGAQLAVFDSLSPEELAVHRQLWPTFVEARRLGHRAQFHGAQLTVTTMSADGAPRRRFTICGEA